MSIWENAQQAVQSFAAKSPREQSDTLRAAAQANGLWVQFTNGDKQKPDDARLRQNDDGSFWWVSNAVQLGFVVATVPEPKHSIAAKAVDSVEHDPVGAAGLGLAVLSGGAALPLIAGVAQVGIAAAAIGDGTGLTHGATRAVVNGAVSVAENPATAGRYLIGGELAAAAVLVPGSKAVDALGSKALAASAPAPAPQHVAASSVQQEVRSAAPADNAIAAPVHKGFFAKIWAELVFAFTGREA